MSAPEHQTPFPHTLLQCLVFVARRHGVDLAVDRLVHDNALPPVEPDLETLAKIAKRNNFKSKVSRLSFDEVATLGNAFPVVARLKNGNGVVLLGVGTREGQARAAVVDPLADQPGIIYLDRAQLEKSWAGEVLLLKRRAALTDQEQPFGFRWFIPELLRQRKYFIDVAIAAILIAVVGLATPLFFQIVIDKVLVHHSQATLYALTAGIILAVLFEVAFGFLRQYMLLFATKRVDIRLARRTFGHLLSLPLAFFERRYAGVLTKHMQQTEKIRRFLTGRLFLTVLDALALLVFIPVLFFYSVSLTFVVLFFSFMIASVIAVLIKPFRRRLRDLYMAEGDRQAFLVENIHGMNTVKSLAIEPQQRRHWDDRAAQAVAQNYKVGMISAVAQNLTQLLQKLMVIAVIAFGAYSVFAGTLTVGALVAFQMLAGRVSGPLVALVSLIHEYQETGLSVQMLGEVMNAQPEQSTNIVGLRPRIKGRVTFERVTFSYLGSTIPALADINLDIPAGTVLGVVGKSGSGKTTLGRLIQGLYPVQEGVIRLDGVNIREIDVTHLRRSIGVVLQESFLFRGTVRENIARTRSDASFADILRVSKIAGVDEFVDQLPQGFDTQLEEGAVNLSGGQKQRLAIARTLLTSPRILILDEATSALDPDSEAIFKRNLAEIARDRTVIIISHRLTNLVDVDQIIVLQRGQIIGQGTHQRLLQDCHLYRHLWQQQVGGAVRSASL
ncbi:MAG: peptidase domain-containing ABC transporter [Thermodesulfobacteriota bacterium]